MRETVGVTDPSLASVSTASRPPKPDMSSINTYAPLLLYHKYEHHFLGDPEEFRQHVRFRQSNFDGRKDRGWNTKHRRWENNNNDGADYRGTDWPGVKQQIHAVMQDLRPGGPTRDGNITRPRDKRNMWRFEDNTRGFFLQLADGFGRGGSGCTPDSPLPIFCDIDRFTVAGRRYVSVLYWFFYIQNWFIIYTHEGDWEHVTLYFEEKDFENGRGPSWVYFASHNTGHVFRANDKKLTYEDNTHLHVYVSRFGHPSSPKVLRRRRADYRHKIKTWEQPIPLIEDFDWSTYCGAWGAVGESVHTTGPLGPFFKRNKDMITISRKLLEA